MSVLVLDIETAALPEKGFDGTTKKLIQEKLVKELEQNSAKNPREFYGLSPYTGQVVAVGTVDSEQDRGAVYYLDPSGTPDNEEDGGIIFRSFATEAELLIKFWEIAAKYDRFATFNGRGFDVPFLSIRSAINKIRPSKDLLQGRYLYQQKSVTHVDLFDQLTFYGCFRFNTGGSLHMACQAFGINTPKEDEIDGSKVSAMFEKKLYKEIARYNLRDIRATKQLFEYWAKYLS